MDSRGRRLHRVKYESSLSMFEKAKDFLGTLFLHALSLIIIAGFLIWALNQV
ncbi:MULTISPECIES: hypothetical protein [Bacillus]|uniref:hypothetical protein n=1 Tax=Bacillus TaxID=1386 RepID=UPI0012FF422D|nr:MULTISPECIES: hypothetical protein [Bacillus]